ncbi:unnamed protein product [Ceratitis capitata]|uniref:(Mediterranean fruit fly) hypothetical protein n=1 Tax=Ceratitis capitata TaxID=7213 RepID=A0A811UC02_CERCA|nr:unnamed protein product [Ceratitis capitata]
MGNAYEVTGNQSEAHGTYITLPGKILARKRYHNSPRESRGVKNETKVQIGCPFISERATIRILNVRNSSHTQDRSGVAIRVNKAYPLAWRCVEIAIIKPSTPSYSADSRAYPAAHTVLSSYFDITTTLLHIALGSIHIQQRRVFGIPTSPA